MTDKRFFYISIWNYEFDHEELEDQYIDGKFQPIKSVHYEIIKCKVLSMYIDWENDESQPLNILFDLQPMTKLPSWFDTDEYESMFYSIDSKSIYYHENDPHPFHFNYLKYQ